MARKGKNKHHKRSCYTKEQFSNVFCTNCILCKPKTPPDFCHNIYKKAPQDFLGDCYQGLLEVSKQIYENADRYDLGNIDVATFKEIFCHSYICFDKEKKVTENCLQLDGCFAEFRNQIGYDDPTETVAPNEEEYERDPEGVLRNSEGVIAISKMSKKEKKKLRKAQANKDRKVVTPYPTFFSSKNEIFQARIRQILYGEHTGNTGEQDTNKELSGAGAGTPDREAESEQPVIPRCNQSGQECMEDTAAHLLFRHLAG